MLLLQRFFSPLVLLAFALNTGCGTSDPEGSTGGGAASSEGGHAGEGGAGAAAGAGGTAGAGGGGGEGGTTAAGGSGGGTGSAGPTCFSDVPQDTYAPGLTKVGAAGYSAVLLESEPAPPAKGDNTWTVRFLDPEGNPLSGLTIGVYPFMPDHGHGTAVVAEVTPGAEAGTYVIAPVNLFMSGVWTVTLSIVDPATGVKLDAVKLAFCV
jgi:hypothetical protein